MDSPTYSPPVSDALTHWIHLLPNSAWGHGYFQCVGEETEAQQWLGVMQLSDDLKSGIPPPATP